MKPFSKTALLAGVVMTLLCGLAGAQAQTGNQTVMHTPDEVLGEGEYLVRRTILDPVTQQPWALKPYRLIVYADGRAIADYEGLTDAEGRTLSSRFAQPVDDKDVAARPVFGKGEYKADFVFTSYSGVEAVKNKTYLLAASGRIFLAMSDELGHTAEVRFPEPGGVSVIVRPGEPAGWREEAAILNRTVEVETPQERMALLEQALSRAERQPEKSVASPAMLLEALLFNAMRVPEALPAIEQRLLQTQLARAAENESGAIPDSARLQAVTEVLKMERKAGQRVFDPQSALLRQALDLAQNLPTTQRADALRSLLFLNRILLDTGEIGLAAGIVRANALDEQLGDNDADHVRQLAMLSEMALAQGHAKRARTLFSLANALRVMNLADQEKGRADELAGLRPRFPGIGPQDMLVSAEAIAGLRRQCAVAMDMDLPLFILGKRDISTIEDAMRSIRFLELMPAIDAMLTQGELKPGVYRRAASCAGAAEKPVTVDANDLRLIHGLSMLGPLLVLENDELFKEFVKGQNSKQPPPGMMEHWADALSVFLEQAQLPPGRYPIVKLAKPFKFKIF